MLKRMSLFGVAGKPELAGDGDAQPSQLAAPTPLTSSRRSSLRASGSRRGSAILSRSGSVSGRSALTRSGSTFGVEKEEVEDDVADGIEEDESENRSQFIDLVAVEAILRRGQATPRVNKRFPRSRTKRSLKPSFSGARTQRARSRSNSRARSLSNSYAVEAVEDGVLNHTAFAKRPAALRSDILHALGDDEDAQQGPLRPSKATSPRLRGSGRIIRVSSARSGLKVATPVGDQLSQSAGEAPTSSGLPRSWSGLSNLNESGWSGRRSRRARARQPQMGHTAPSTSNGLRLGIPSSQLGSRQGSFGAAVHATMIGSNSLRVGDLSGAVELSAPSASEEVSRWLAWRARRQHAALSACAR